MPLDSNDRQILKRLGRNLRAIRHLSGMKIQDIAKATGIDNRTLKKIENGQVNSGILSYLKFKHHFCIKGDDLLYKLQEDVAMSVVYDRYAKYGDFKPQDS